MGCEGPEEGPVALPHRTTGRQALGANLRKNSPRTGKAGPADFPEGGTAPFTTPLSVGTETAACDAFVAHALALVFPGSAIARRDFL